MFYLSRNGRDPKNGRRSYFYVKYLSARTLVPRRHLCDFIGFRLKKGFVAGKKNILPSSCFFFLVRIVGRGGLVILRWTQVVDHERCTFGIRSSLLRSWTRGGIGLEVTLLARSQVCGLTRAPTSRVAFPKTDTLKDGTLVPPHAPPSPAPTSPLAETSGGGSRLLHTDFLREP